MRKSSKAALITSVVAIVSGKLSASIPKRAHAVHPFNSKKYLGKWYEIVRMDLLFERNLINVTARYFENDDGTIKGKIGVMNRIKNLERSDWKSEIPKNIKQDYSEKDKIVGYNTSELKWVEQQDNF